MSQQLVPHMTHSFKTTRAMVDVVVIKSCRYIDDVVVTYLSLVWRF